jgi:hypothetical protein
MPIATSMLYRSSTREDERSTIALGRPHEAFRFGHVHNFSSYEVVSELLTGVDTHLNGLGNMDEWAAPNQWGEEGYEGYLNNRVVTLPHANLIENCV